MRTFLIIWLGQLISTVGSGLTSFALGVWIYLETGSPTLFALNILLFTLPGILFSPLIGSIVDRADRRWVMVGSDVGAGSPPWGSGWSFRVGNWRCGMSTWRPF